MASIPTRSHSRRLFLGAGLTVLATNAVVPARVAAAADADAPAAATDAQTSALPKAFIDGTAFGWKPLTGDDFVNVNGAKDTWTWKGGMVKCTGKPTCVMRTQQQYTNFELVCQWRHLRNAGNSGIFVWATEQTIKQLAAAGKPGLPKGIEVQVLDPGYTEFYEKKYDKKADWFTCHGDVFPVKGSRMKPFPPVAPNGSRSFPSKHTTNAFGHWNHYYLRAINGEIRLWVNGVEVSGGTECNPRSGYLCLESEGAPIEFKDLRIRVLP